MDTPEVGPSDYEIEQSIGKLLRIGVTLSAVVVGIAGALYLVRYGAQPPEYRVFHGEPAFLRSVRAIAQGAVTLRRRDLIMVGILLLIATPIARVIFSAVAFLRQRDYLYFGVTLVVLAVLFYSLVWGRS